MINNDCTVGFRARRNGVAGVLTDGGVTHNYVNTNSTVIIAGMAIQRFGRTSGAHSGRVASANAIAYSIIETAKANGLNAFKYLTYLFENLPNLSFLQQPDLLESFLPWSEKVKESCR